MPFHNLVLEANMSATFRLVLLTFLLVVTTSSASAQVSAQPATATTAQPAQLSLTDLINKGTLDGKSAASSKSSSGYFAGGVLGGLGLGLIGTGVVYGVAASSSASVPEEQRPILLQNGSEYFQAYESAYEAQVKRKRKGAALGGGLLGTAAIVVVVLTSAGN